MNILEESRIKFPKSTLPGAWWSCWNLAWPQPWRLPLVDILRGRLLQVSANVSYLMKSYLIRRQGSVCLITKAFMVCMNDDSVSKPLIHSLRVWYYAKWIWLFSIFPLHLLVEVRSKHNFFNQPHFCFSIGFRTILKTAVSPALLKTCTVVRRMNRGSWWDAQ